MTDDGAILRRADDRRIGSLEEQVTGLATRVALLEQAQNNVRDSLTGVQKSVDRIGEKVDSIATGLSEAQGSAAGRALYERSVNNATAIEALGKRIEDVEDWRTEMRGAYRLLPAIAVIASSAAVILGLIQAAQLFGAP